MLLVALEPEEESPILFLRLRKAARKGLAVFSVSRAAQQRPAQAVRHADRRRARATSRPCWPGWPARPSPTTASATPPSATGSAPLLRTPGAVVLVGERAAQTPGSADRGRRPGGRHRRRAGLGAAPGGGARRAGRRRARHAAARRSSAVRSRRPGRGREGLGRVDSRNSGPGHRRHPGRRRHRRAGTDRLRRRGRGIRRRAALSRRGRRGDPARTGRPADRRGGDLRPARPGRRAGRGGQRRIRGQPGDPGQRRHRTGRRGVPGRRRGGEVRRLRELGGPGAAVRRRAARGRHARRGPDPGHPRRRDGRRPVHPDTGGRGRRDRPAGRLVRCPSGRRHGSRRSPATSGRDRLPAGVLADEPGRRPRRWTASRT